jgi:hypothetical protein
MNRPVTSFAPAASSRLARPPVCVDSSPARFHAFQRQPRLVPGAGSTVTVTVTSGP